VISREERNAELWCAHCRAWTPHRLTSTPSYRGSRYSCALCHSWRLLPDHQEPKTERDRIRTAAQSERRKIAAHEWYEKNRPRLLEKQSERYRRMKIRS